MHGGQDARCRPRGCRSCFVGVIVATRIWKNNVEREMKRSSDRILTTHVGSLPRPDDLFELMLARMDGKPVDDAAYAARIRQAVEVSVKQQADAGLDVVSDGEM